jgi:hypothetical protein
MFPRLTGYSEMMRNISDMQKFFRVSMQFQFHFNFQLWGPPHRVAFVGPLGAPVVFVRDIFILDEIWTQDKIHILVGTFLGLNILLTT